MKAVIYTQYGSPDVLQVKEVTTPTPKDNEVLIKVRASSVNYGDLAARNFRNISPREFNMPFLFWMLAKLAFGLKKPRQPILGSEFSGEVEAIGKDVKRFSVGDQVFGYLGQNMGGYAQKICVPENGCLVLKPAALTFEEAAVIPYGAIMALHLVRKMNIWKGQNILIIGASGGIGSAAVQIARHFGAEVTGVCSSSKVDFVKSLGANSVIDYSKESFPNRGISYDLIFDVLGRGYPRCINSLKPNGRYFLASFKSKHLFKMIRTSFTGGIKVICIIAPGSLEDLISVKELIEKGVIKPGLDRSFSMQQAAEAHRYVESGEAKGKVAISIN